MTTVGLNPIQKWDYVCYDERWKCGKKHIVHKWKLLKSPHSLSPLIVASLKHVLISLSCEERINNGDKTSKYLTKRDIINEMGLRLCFPLSVKSDHEDTIVMIMLMKSNLS